MDFSNEKEKVVEGEYEIDYSKIPAKLKINWFIDGKIHKCSGYIWLIGGKQNQMHLCTCTYTEYIPSLSAKDDQMCWWLTKKVKK